MLQRITGISSNIDSCGGMIVKQAAVTYHTRISAHHRRWVDPEDIVQDGLVAALETERHKFKKGHGTKFSTFLYRRLNWQMSRIADGLRRQKRSLPGLVELDAPVPGSEDDKPVEIADGQALHSDKINCIQSFITLCRSVSQPAIVVLIRGFLFADSRPATPEICVEIGQVAARLGIGINDLSMLRHAIAGHDDTFRKKLLTLISKEVMMVTGTEELIRCLECTECGGKFSIAAIRDGRFFVSSMCCRHCHKKMQKAPVTESCFGKPKTSKREGFSESDVECRLLCQDKEACRQFSRSGKMSDKKTKGVDDVDFSKVEGKAKAKAAKVAPKAKSVEKKAAKSEKAPKVKKAPKEIEWDKGAYPFNPNEAPPKETGVVEWPYKRGSTMLSVFMHMLKGVDKKKIQAAVEAQGSTWKQMYAIMKRFEHREHTWKLNEEGARYQIFDVKFRGGKKAAEKKAA